MLGLDKEGQAAGAGGVAVADPAEEVTAGPAGEAVVLDL